MEHPKASIMTDRKRWQTIKGLRPKPARISIGGHLPIVQVVCVGDKMNLPEWKAPEIPEFLRHMSGNKMNTQKSEEV